MGRRWIAALLLGTALALASAIPAGAATVQRPLAESNYGVRPLCGDPGPGEASCMALELVPETAAARARATPLGMTVRRQVEPHSAASGSFGLRPQDLHSGYGLPSVSPVQQTIAIVDAYDDPTAEADLAHYSQEFGLPECTAASGCFTKVNQEGNASPLPQADSGWSGEIALDVESAHATCQNCKILLVEANNSFSTSLEAAENTAARLGATEISNSFGGPSEPTVEGSAYNHPGIVITASTGDHGYLDWDNHSNPFFIGHPEFPASSPKVVAVGGTRLMLASGAWSSERVWNDGSSTGLSEGAGGSACSEHLSAQSWQTAVADWGAVGCAGKRAAADVAADADPFTGVAVYQGGNWSTVGGTSLASPIVASVFALAGGSGGVSYSAQTLYGHLGLAGLHDITVGSNGECAKEFDFVNLTAGCTSEEEEADCGGTLICKAASGYDGPTGVGTPSGVTAFVPPAPTVTGISPDEGALGTVVTISGEHLTGAVSVKFGNAAATDLEEVSSTELKATAPGGTGEVDVTVTNGGGTSTASANDRFTYLPNPAIASLEPSRGALGGGTTVTIRGERLNGVDGVEFDGIPATSFHEVSSTELIATTPAHAEGEVDVTMQTSHGASATTSFDRFAYVAAPTVSSVEPDSGSSAGGETVTIKGTNLTEATAVEFGGATATDLDEISATELTVTSPAHIEGTVDVTVTTPGGTSATSAADRFAYVQHPVVEGVSPGEGPAAGGTLVTITGHDLGAATKVEFGSAEATGLAVKSAGEIRATSPPHAAGAVDVVVTSSSGASAVVAADRFTYVAAPVNSGQPTISGTAVEGQTLTAQGGSWENAPTSFSYQWLRCDSSGANCAAIAGATEASYELAAADVGHTIAVEVTAHNPGGQGSATSARTAVVVPPPPANTSLPTISGTATEDQTLTVGNGSWTNNPTSFTYRWLRCDSAGANCAAIGSATAQTYVLTATDVGHRLKVEVTAHNAGGEGSATSAATAPVATLDPVNTTLPEIEGSAVEGQTLTAKNGGWQNSPTSYAYRWLRCLSNGSSCQAIAGATSQTYLLGPEDLHRTLKVEVTAENTHGQASATSAPTSEVVFPVPAEVSPPTITGSAAEGQILTAASGDWDHEPTSFTYQWLRCDSEGHGCEAISGGTGSTFFLDAAEVGHRIEVEVTAHNAGGQATASSEPTPVVVPQAPIMSALPTITGSAVEGQTLTTTNGTWTHSPTSFTYQWLRCDSNGANCGAIGSATSQAYELVTADVGHRLKVEVTAHNAGGQASVTSAATAVVAAAAPVNTSLPQIEGSAAEGKTLTAQNGTWTHSPTSDSYRWLRCSSSGTGCAAIAGATAQTYQLVSTDVGHELEVEVTAHNSGGQAAATSAATAPVVATAPANTSPPEIEGSAQEGETLTAKNGTWTNGPTSFTYKWLRCDSAGASCAAIAGATAQTYQLTATDVGHELKVEVTAHNAEGQGSATSAATALVASLKPAETAPPEIEGGAFVEETLTAKNGTWTNGPTSFTYQWLRCFGATGSCSAIAGATAQTYTLLSEDAFYTIAVEVTAENSHGHTSATSGRTAEVTYAPPVNLTSPSVEGSAAEGQILTAQHGSWSRSPSFYSYKWLRCDSAGANCSAIANASGISYLVVEADVGHTIEIEVTAHNNGGQSTATSGPTAAVVPRAPTVTSAPSITGSAARGQTLTATNGTWTHDPTNFTYQWLRCDSAGANCAAIGSASSQTYELVAADVGHSLKVEVTAHNAGGQGTATSAATSSVAGLLPVNTALPEIEGGAQEGETLTARSGNWENSPTSFTYKWLRCDSAGANCVAIGSASSQTYELVATDVGHRLKVEVTAHNAEGQGSATSAATAVVATLKPVDTALPEIEGTPYVERTLTAKNGTWENSPTSYAYQWLDCFPGGGSCSPISGATGQTYTLVSQDAFYAIRVEVIAENSHGQVSARSEPTATVEYGVPVNLTRPSIEGSPAEGQVLTAQPGAWEFDPVFYEYRWLRCDAEARGCEAISGGTFSTHLVEAADVGHRLEVEVTAVGNGGGKTAATSDPTAVVAQHAPANSAPPAITGSTVEEETLTATNGTWTNSPESFTYKWLRCDSAGANCATIGSATAQTYELTSADVGHKLKVEVTAHNPGGEGSASSAASALVTVAPPVNEALPEAEGTAREGETLTAEEGTWSHTPTSFTYRWLRCDSSGANCAPIGATGRTYELAAADAGSTIEVEVTAHNSGGQTAATSEPTAVVEPLPPVNSSAPTITGSTVEGQTLAATNGTWSHDPTSFTYQWLRCDAGALKCVPIAAATSQSYLLTSQDVGHKLKVEVTAHNAGGEQTAASGLSGLVTTPVPANTGLPTISGGTVEGQTLTATEGTWTHSPTSFTYQWLRCDSSGAGCSVIVTTTSQTYELTASDVGHTIRAEVTAENDGGTGSATSAATAVIKPLPPVNSSAPTITGSTVEGQTLTTTDGTWTHSPTSFTYKWLRCDSSGGNCAAIGGATAQTYQLTAADAGHELKVEVSAHNAGGDGSATSPATATVQLPPAPLNTVLPAISGSAVEGQTLTAGDGSWEHGPVSYAYRWLRCDFAGANCAPISGATAGTYTLTADDAGHTVRLEVTASGPGGPSSATSAPTDAVKPPPPVDTTPVTIAGSAVEGETLSATNGTWTHSPTFFTYKWLRCDSAGASCSAIAGATAQTYALTATEVAHRLEAEVTAHGAGGEGSATSAPSAVVTPGQPGVGETPGGSGETFAGGGGGGTGGGGGSEGSAGGSAEHVNPAPAAGTAVAGSRALFKYGRVAIALHCPGQGPCGGTLLLQVASGAGAHGKRNRVYRKGALTIGRASFSIAAGASATVSVHLTGKGQALVRKAGQKGLEAQLSGTGVAPRQLKLEEK
jgi:IPT/TIG domain-containing protein